MQDLVVATMPKKGKGDVGGRKKRRRVPLAVRVRSIFVNAAVEDDERWEWTYAMIMMTVRIFPYVIMPMALSEGAQRGEARLSHPVSDPDSLGPSLMRPCACSNPSSKARSLSTCPSAR